MLEPAPNLWRTLTYYNGGHDESWNQQAYLLEPAVGFVAYGGVRVHDGSWNQQQSCCDGRGDEPSLLEPSIFLLEAAIYFATTR